MNNSVETEASNNKRWLKIALPIVMLVIVILIFGAMKIFRPQAKIAPAQQEVIKVSTLALSAKTQQVVIASQGFIEPAYRTTLNAELVAKVIWVSKKFEPGVYVSKGTPLVRFDTRDAKSELQQAKSGLINAEVALETENNRSTLAMQEWQIVQEGESKILDKPSNLTLRKPQLKAAKATVSGQKARVNRAKMLVERGTLYAPYNGYIVNRSVSPGQSVLNGNRLGEIIGADSLRLRLPIGLEDISKINIDGENKPKVDWQHEGQKWSASITRVAQEVNSQTRKIDVVVDIDKRKPEFKNLRSGVFVTASIYSKNQDEVYAIPRIVLNKSNQAPFIKNGQLIWKTLTFIGGDGDNFWVSKDDKGENGINADELLITSNVQIFPNGTKITNKDIVPVTNQSKK